MVVALPQDDTLRAARVTVHARARVRLLLSADWLSRFHC
jgi:hypothetical protein